MAHRLGLGPNVVAQKISAFFGTGDERRLRLIELRNNQQIPATLEKYCSRLMGYTLPCVSLVRTVFTVHSPTLLLFHSTESPSTQRQAFEKVVTLTTLLPGLQLLFLRSRCMRRVPITKDDISELWDRSDISLDPDWSYWRTFAATCLSEARISAMLEATSVSQLADCQHDNGDLSVIERLLIARGCE
jgi:hypothetical protein